MASAMPPSQPEKRGLKKKKDDSRQVTITHSSSEKKVATRWERFWSSTGEFVGAVPEMVAVLGMAILALGIGTLMAFGLGQSISSSLIEYDAAQFGPPNGGPDEEPDGGGGPDNDDDPFDTMVSNWFLWMIVYFVLFLLAAIYLFGLLANFPYRWSWLAHYQYNRWGKYQPYLALFFLYAANYIPTWLIERYYTPRVFASFLSALFGTAHFVGFRFWGPKLSAELVDKDLSSLSESEIELINSKPNLRAALFLFAAASLIFYVLILLPMVPALFTTAPKNWYEIFYIWK